MPKQQIPRFDVSDIKYHAKWLHDVDLTDSQAELIHEKLLEMILATGGGWATVSRQSDSDKRSAGGLTAWLKFRLIEIGAIQACGHRASESTIRLTCTMHVFFIGIVETEEHIRILNNTDDESIAEQVARSKIAKYLKTKYAKPINRTTHKVAPLDHRDFS